MKYSADTHHKDFSADSSGQLTAAWTELVSKPLSSRARNMKLQSTELLLDTRITLETITTRTKRSASDNTLMIL